MIIWLGRQSRPSLTRHPGRNYDDATLSWSVASPLFEQ